MRAAHFAVLSLLLAAPAIAAPAELARDTWLIPGGIPKGRQPDGNTVIWRGADGLVVLDTGRHAAHTDAIIDFAGDRAVKAIINSHWHLDHVSGNLRLKTRWPGARVYASNAITGALAGFLPRSAKASEQLLAEGKLPPDTQDDLRLDLATIAAGEQLKPDVTVTKSRTLTLAGRVLRLKLTRGATEGDIWVYDPATRLVAVGDLVTLPVPFLDTADAQAWSRALGEIAATDFKILVPGHGAPMDRAGFSRYRAAFDRLLSCAATHASACGEGWMAETASLRAPDDEERARGMIGYYVDLLRRKA